MHIGVLSAMATGLLHSRPALTGTPCRHSYPAPEARLCAVLQASRGATAGRRQDVTRAPSKPGAFTHARPGTHLCDAHHASKLLSARDSQLPGSILWRLAVYKYAVAALKSGPRLGERVDLHCQCICLVFLVSARGETPCCTRRYQLIWTVPPSVALRMVASRSGPSA